ncbi:MAG: RNA-directed DNA polymerase, partial [Bacteroidia bacterium]|nr:RNA-directed DNA polymerase [Bacteroidia bacterium]
RGVSLAVNRVKRAMRDRKGSAWCLKIDIKKFYPNINQQVLISDLKRKFKDEKFISLISEIICSTEKGLPIGSYTSQLLANYAVSRLDHIIKEKIGVRYYFRYCDDMVFLGHTKEQMWNVFRVVEQFVQSELRLEIKANYAVFPVGEERRSNGQRTNGQVNRLSGVPVHTQQGVAA